MISGFACYNPKESLKNFSYDPGPLKDNDVEVRISHCGICHSDVHLIDNDWGVSQYPFIPGHEIVGTVVQKGKNVIGLETGQRVGIGWQRGCCGVCEFCTSGQENLCDLQTATCIAHHGGYADAIRIHHRFAFIIPDTLSSETAAPLLCGGITVYSPLKTQYINATSRVGVVGIGGLGHMALQFARAFGCDVTALSSTKDKEAEAKSFGANRFIVMRDQEAMKAASNSLDLIISAVSGDIKIGTLLPLLRPKGKICIVGASTNTIDIPAAALIGRRYGIVGSNIGSPHEINEMLAFAARHGIRTKTEVMPMTEVNNALDKVRANQARYRIVLKV